MRLRRAWCRLTLVLLCFAVAACGGGGGEGQRAVAPPGGNQSLCGSVGGVQYVLAYQSTQSRWCIDQSMWAAHQTAITGFFSYGDAVVNELETLFAVTPSGLPFTYEVQQPFGGAHTGSDFGLGDTVTGDAFYNVFQDPVSGKSIPGFYGYLLTLHEAINVWTGTVSPGWPVDWWADDRSPFPNAMDYRVMQTIGNAENNSTLLAAATAQNEIFTDQQLSTYDSEVVMFDSLFDQFGGFGAYANAFRLVQGDGLQWPAVGADPSPLLTEYVIAYLQLGFRTTTDLTQSVFIADGVGTKDKQIPPYTVDSIAVKGIADAHCSIRAAAGAGIDVSGPLAALRRGDYQHATVSGGKQSTCPSECFWLTSQNQCAAPWS